jgi:hypothetical protein
VELEALAISALTKEELRQRFAKIQKEVVDEQKKRQKAESKTALDTVQGHFKKEEHKDSKFFVGHLPISANAKAISDVITHYKTKEKETTVYVFAGSKDDAVMHGVYVGTVCFFSFPHSSHSWLIGQSSNANMSNRTSPPRASRPSNGPPPSPRSLAARRAARSRAGRARAPTRASSTRRLRARSSGWWRR